MRHPLKALQLCNLRLKFSDGLRRCCAIHEPILVRFHFLAGRLVEVVLVQGGLGRWLRYWVVRLLTGAAFPFFLQPGFETCKTAFQRFVDCRGRGGKSTLQDLEGKADIVPSPCAVIGQAVRAVHFLAHIVGHRFVELVLA